MITCSGLSRERKVGKPEPRVRHRKPSHGSIKEGPDTPPSCLPLVPAPEGSQGGRKEGRVEGGKKGGARDERRQGTDRKKRKAKEGLGKDEGSKGGTLGRKEGKRGR